MKSSIVVIPARYNSTRFPGKPLADMKGKSMIQRVYEQCVKSNASKVVVATDNLLIYNEVIKFGGMVYMTKECESGTERVCEIVLGHGADIKFDIIVNVQGDEPFINPEDINKIIDMVKSNPNKIATLVTNFTKKELTDRNVVKVILDTNEYKKAAMFTRSPVYGKLKNCFKHIGIYGFSYKMLETISALNDRTRNETIDNLEQLRWLDNGLKINTNFTEHKSIGIDTLKDLLDALKLL